MVLPSISPRAYHRVTLVALVLLGTIIVTGAAVRLTGSGLGCSDWPNCEQGRLIAPLELHPMVEFVNRLFTGLVSVAVILAVLGALAAGAAPHRSHVARRSASSQASSARSCSEASRCSPTCTRRRSRATSCCRWRSCSTPSCSTSAPARHPGRTAPTVPAEIRRLALALAAWATIVLVTGTVVTGTGPHGGDENARRFGFDITTSPASTASP